MNCASEASNIMQNDGVPVFICALDIAKLSIPAFRDKITSLGHRKEMNKILSNYYVGLRSFRTDVPVLGSVGKLNSRCALSPTGNNAYRLMERPGSYSM